jgi:hypothetical protein
VAPLVALLPLFGQTFHYMKVLPPLWALSKAFPVLALPLALVLLAGARAAGTRQVLVTFVWLLIVPTLIATWTFQQTFFVGLAAQVKLLPLLYFFSFLGLLRWLQPTLREVAASFLIVAAATMLALTLIWLAAPQSWYSGHYAVGDAPLLSQDSRGNRIRMPMYFGIIGIFFCLGRFLQGRRIPWLLLALSGVALIFFLVRTRSTVLGVLVILALNVFLAASTRMRLVLVALLPLAAVAIFSTSYMASIFSTDQASGFDIRWISTVKAVAFLGDNPLRWVFGVGTISPLDPAALMTYFNHFFFLADITWVGVLFEYGLIGALLILALPLRGLTLLQSAGHGTQDAFLGALKSYLLYVILISELYPMTLTPGEIAVILAVAAYRLDQLRQPAAATPAQ